MKRLIRRLTQNDYVFTVIARLLSFALGMVYSVLYSRYLHSELRGDVAVILNYSSFAMLILCFGINQGYPFFRKEKPQMAYKEYIDMIAAFFLLYCGVACIFVLLYQGDPAWRYTAVMIPLLFAVKELNYAVMIEKPYIRNVAAISLSVFDILLILIFYCFTEANFALAMVLIIVKEVIYTGVAVFQSGIRLSQIRPSFRNARKYILYGVLPMITVIMMDVNYRIDVLMLDSFHVLKADIGVYTLAVSLAEKVWLIPDAMKDMLVSKLAKGSSEEEVCRVTRISVALVIVLCLMLIAVGYPAIMLLYGLEYEKAYEVILHLLIGIVGMVFYKTVYSYNVTRGERTVNLVFLGIAALSNVLANWLLIPVCGVVGAAIASSISYFICGIVFLVYFCRKTHSGLSKMTILRREDFDTLKNLVRRTE